MGPTLSRRGPAVTNRLNNRPGIEIVGHRGAAGIAPENTLPSFEAAWAQRGTSAGAVAWVETDVRLTRDGVPVLMHDATLDRTTTGHGPLSALTDDETRRIDAGVRFAPEFAGTRVPRLDELLAAAAGRSGVLIELKAEPERAELLVRQVLVAVEAAGAAAWVRLISFDPDLLERVSWASPRRSVPTGLIASSPTDLVETAQRLGCAAIHPGLAALFPPLIASAHAAGLRVNTWTANTPEQVQRAAEAGADEITTDFPAMALQALGLSADPGILS
jgi:glycerophosphoryl diester phosphodiesterase